MAPPCLGCGELPLGFTPLVAQNSKNVALASPKDFYGKSPGTWCFILEGDIDPSTATVIASAVDSENNTGDAATSAQWVRFAPDCEAGEIEIKTFIDAIKEGKVVTEPGVAVAFSFFVP